MPLIALASLKASPGVTTTALALAAAWPAPRRLLIEADPSGGDLSLWLGLPPDPGLTGLAASVRHDHGQGMTWHHAQEPAAGTHVVLAPAGAEQAAACVATLAGTSVLNQFVSGAPVAVVDCGCLYPGSPALPVAAQATLTLLLIRPRLGELAHLEPRIPSLEQAGLRLGLVLAPAGRRPPPDPAYPADEIAATLKIPVHAALPPDSRAVQHLIHGRGDPGAARRLPLLRAVASLAAALSQSTSPDPGTSATGSAEPQDHDEKEVTAGDRH
jgi:hypothetical protein